MHLSEGINSLLELDVVRGQLSLRSVVLAIWSRACPSFPGSLIAREFGRHVYGYIFELSRPSLTSHDLDANALTLP